jgi:hypothetical protein
VRAIAFLALSRQDFLGGGGGISSVPWLAGLSCQAALALLKRSEILSFRWAIDMTVVGPVFSACLARVSARSFPGAPEWPYRGGPALVCHYPEDLDGLGLSGSSSGVACAGNGASGVGMYDYGGVISVNKPPRPQRHKRFA